MTKQDQAQKLAKYIAISPDGTSAEITLTKQRSLAGRSSDKVVMREPQVDDQLTAANYSDNSMDQEIFLIGNLLGAAPEEIRKLPMRDYIRLQAAYSSFLS